MKKVILSLIMMLIIVSGSNGAVSEDMSVYVRKDIYEVHMQSMNEKLDMILQKLDKLDSKVDRNTQAISALSERVTALSTRVDGLEATLTAKIEGTNRRIDGLDEKLTARIDGLDAKQTANIAGTNGRINGLEARMGDLRNNIYLGWVILGILISLPIFQKMFQGREKKKEREETKENQRRTITLEDVKRLIEENNLKLRNSMKV